MFKSPATRARPAIVYLRISNDKLVLRKRNLVEILTWMKNRGGGLGQPL